MTPQRTEIDIKTEEGLLRLDNSAGQPAVSKSSLTLFAWLAALLVLFVAAPNFNLMFCIRAVEAVLIGAAIVSALRRSGDAKPEAQSLVLAVFAALTAISAVVGLIGEYNHPSPYRSIVFGGSALGPLQVLVDQIAALAAFALLSVNQTPEDYDRRAGFRFAVESTAACVALLCALELAHDHSAGARIDAGFGNPNLLASFLVMCFPIPAAGVFSRSDGPSLSRRCARALIAGVIVAAVWYTGSRGALLGVGAGAGLLFVAWIVRTRGPMAKAVLSAAATLVAVAGAVFWLHGSAAVRGISHARSDQQRVVVWHAAVAIVRSHPLLGVGLGGFPSAMAALHLREPNPTTVSGLPLTPAVHLHAHNIVLQYAAERGLPGLCAVVALLAFLMAAALSPRRMIDSPSFQLACGYGLIGVAVQNVFDYTLWYAPLLILAWSLAGVLAVKPSKGEVAAQNLVITAGR